MKTGLMLLASVAALAVATAAWADADQPGGALPLPEGGPKGETPRLANGHPDMTGFWVRRGDPYGVNVVNKAWRLGPGKGPKQRDGSQDNDEIDAEFYTKMSPDMPQYKPEYWAQIHENEEFKYRRPADPMYGCKNPGVVRLAAPVELFENANKVTMVYPFPLEDPTSSHLWVRDVSTNNPKLPDADHYQGVDPFGTSSGHWEGDTLVITTVDFPTDGVWYNVRGWVSSAETKITERLRRQGDTLYYDITVDDPAFVKPWVRPTLISTLDTSPNRTIRQPLPCVEMDAQFLPPSTK